MRFLPEKKETLFVIDNTGVHSAFIGHVNLLKGKDDVEVIKKTPESFPGFSID
jgi:hypothetical protein